MGEDGLARPLSVIWRGTPWALGAAAGLVQSLAGAGFRPAIRLLLAERGEVLP
jgi:demethoxyubiquinone hydroxylase (CLK1/Coq7/Cat5 family)